MPFKSKFSICSQDSAMGQVRWAPPINMISDFPTQIPIQSSVFFCQRSKYIGHSSEFRSQFLRCCWCCCWVLPPLFLLRSDNVSDQTRIGGCEMYVQHHNIPHVYRVSGISFWGQPNAKANGCIIRFFVGFFGNIIFFDATLFLIHI